MKQHETQGFTLIEILIVIAIIGILALVVFIAINPLGRFQDARNATRVSNVEAIGKSAIIDFNVDNAGVWPTGIPTLDTSTYASGFDASGIPQCSAASVTDSNHGVGDGCEWADDSVLVSQLSPKYVGSIPVDSGYSNSDYRYHYYVALTPDQQHIVVISYGFEPGVNTNTGSTPYSTTNPYYKEY